MSKIVIQVDGVGKRYEIGESGGFSYLALRDVLSNVLSAPKRFLQRAQNGTMPAGPKHIWALKDVDLQVGQGEILGLIGRNGAARQRCSRF
jgi:lipopolysaccharide transport system ATP-binding protein